MSGGDQPQRRSALPVGERAAGIETDRVVGRPGRGDRAEIRHRAGDQHHEARAAVSAGDRAEIGHRRGPAGTVEAQHHPGHALDQAGGRAALAVCQVGADVEEDAGAVALDRAEIVDRAASDEAHGDAAIPVRRDRAEIGHRTSRAADQDAAVVAVNQAAGRAALAVDEQAAGIQIDPVDLEGARTGAGDRPEIDDRAAAAADDDAVGAAGDETGRGVADIAAGAEIDAYPGAGDAGDRAEIDDGSECTGNHDAGAHALDKGTGRGALAVIHRTAGAKVNTVVGSVTDSHDRAEIGHRTGSAKDRHGPNETAQFVGNATTRGQDSCRMVGRGIVDRTAVDQGSGGTINFNSTVGGADHAACVVGDNAAGREQHSGRRRPGARDRPGIRDCTRTTAYENALEVSGEDGGASGTVEVGDDAAGDKLDAVARRRIGFDGAVVGDRPDGGVRAVNSVAEVMRSVAVSVSDDPRSRDGCRVLRRGIGEDDAGVRAGDIVRHPWSLSRSAGRQRRRRGASPAVLRVGGWRGGGAAWRAAGATLSAGKTAAPRRHARHAR